MTINLKTIYQYRFIFQHTDCQKPDIQLRLPLNRNAFDPGCDQGYGSERSPEDELPPPLPQLAVAYPQEAAALGLGPLCDYKTNSSNAVQKATGSGFEFSFVTPGKVILGLLYCSAHLLYSLGTHFTCG